MSLERRIVEMMGAVEREGGFISALRSGALQSMIDDASYEYQTDIEEGRRTVVGVDRFAQESRVATSVKVFKVDHDSTARQIERLKAHRDRRDADAVQRALDEMRTAAEGTGNLVEPITGAIRAGATIGEVCDTLHSVLGSWRDERVPL